MSHIDEHNPNLIESCEQEDLFANTYDVCIELSNFCNMAALHPRCPVSKMQNDPHILPARIVNDVLQTLSRHDYSGRIAFYTYNEPLMDPRLFEFVRTARRSCPQSRIHICTNGYCLTQDLVDELVQAGVTSFHISAYSESDLHRFSALAIPVESAVKLMKLDDRLDFYDTDEKSCDKPCYAPLAQVIITSQGMISLCCLDWKRQYCFGDLNAQSFEEAMADRQLRQAYKRLSHGERFLPLCRRCGWSRGNDRFAKNVPSQNYRDLPKPIELTAAQGGKVTIDIIADLSHFTGLSTSDVERLVRRKGYTARDEFREVTDREKNDYWFYIASRYFIFENAVHPAHIDEFVKKHIPEGGSVWEFGGGTGNISLSLAAQGYDVTYTELSSLQKDFVAFRSHKYGLPVTILHSWQPKPVERFDLVLALDVLEHIEQYDKVLDELCRAVKPGGLIWETSAFLKDASNPTHHIADEHDYRRLMCQSGFERIFGCAAGRLWRKSAAPSMQILDNDTAGRIREYASSILPENNDPLLQFALTRGLEEMAVSHYGLAIDYLEEAWAINSKISGKTLFAHIVELAGDLDALEQTLCRILELEPGKNHRLLGEIKPYISAVRHSREAMSLLEKGLSEKAIDEFDTAISAYPNLPGLFESKAKALMQLGLSLSRNGSPDEALKRFDAAIVLSRKTPGLIEAKAAAIVQMGMALLVKGNANGAVEQLEAAVALKQPVPNLGYTRAVALAQLGRYGSAREACLEELKLRPDHKGTLDLLARLDSVLKSVDNVLTEKRQQV